MQSSWAPLASDRDSAEGTQGGKIGFLPTEDSELTAKQRFHRAQRGSVQLG